MSSSIFNSSILNFKVNAIAFMALFSLSALVFVIGSELLIRFHVAPTHGYEAAKSDFLNGDHDDVVFGDSRALSGIGEASGFTNFAAAGENLATSLGKLDAYVASGRGRHVVLQLGPQHFSLYRLALNQAGLLEDFLDTEPHALQMMRPHFRRYLFDYWNAILRNPARLMGTPKAAPSAPAAMPRLAHMAAAERRREAMIRTQLHIPVPGFAQTADMERLRATLGAARDAGITLCVVTFPVSSAYREAARAYPVYAQIRAAYGALADELGVVYLDLWAAYEDRLFANVDHLNGDGSRRLGVDLNAFCRAGG